MISDNQQKITAAKIAILLCTYNGERYLAKQLDSFSVQTYPNWQILASDDGSIDNTLAILKSYQAKWSVKKFSIYSGPAKGFAANFFFLTHKANRLINTDYYTYSDQDDIWQADKLQRAIDWLSTVPKNIPALYSSRTCLIDTNDHCIGFSPLFTKPPGFANALVEAIGGGNTMVFNRAACELVCQASQQIDIISHDLWVYTVISGCGGQIFYDADPSVCYRQHDSNLVGRNNSWPALFVRIRMLFEGRFRNWNDAKIHALQPIEAKLTPENKAILREFTAARNKKFWPRLVGLKRSGIYRQTGLGNLGLTVAAIFNKV
ncbi:glycosyltransferase family 2 protein [Candidatus Regiella insecticola]|uniref:glycosyltransferase family 2 protein n=1 Tax=Candidatus Regiella insecticola TaxID=138073 RepID=UPI00192AC4E8|nr:glycosyltransferase family 2 protein [Candidatus Regiella insecticola]